MIQSNLIEKSDVRVGYASPRRPAAKRSAPRSAMARTALIGLCLGFVVLGLAAPTYAGIKKQLIFSSYDGPFNGENGDGKIFTADLQFNGQVLVNFEDLGVKDPVDGLQTINRFALTPQGIVIADDDMNGDNGSVLFHDSTQPGGVTTSLHEELLDLTDVAYDPRFNNVYYLEKDRGTISTAPLCCSHSTQPFIEGLENPTTMELDPINRKFYVGHNNRIDVFDADTGAFSQSLFVGVGQVNSIALDLEKEKIYFTESGSNTLLVGPSHGDGSLDLVHDDSEGFFPLGFSDIQDVIVDITADRLYWTNRGGLLRGADLDRDTGEIFNIIELAQAETFETIGDSLGVTNDEDTEGHTQFTGIAMAIIFIPDDADFNGDGLVTMDDFDILALNFGEDFGQSIDRGDANGDGATNLADFDIIADQYGMTTGETIDLPEPGSLALLGLAATAMLRRRV